MCCGSTRKSGSMERSECGCSCNCPATMTVEDEIKLLEEHKKFMQDQVGEIDKKIAALQSVKRT